jgi:GT2 family glycosyltransferase
VKVSCVILTMGNRPGELGRAVASALAQDGAGLEVVVVGNGAPVPPQPPGVKTLDLPENLGVAGGRNAGVAACAGDVVLFLDDDGWYPGQDVAQHAASRFGKEPELAVLSFRVADPDGGPGARWHVPRLRADPGRSSAVTTFAGGACAVRRSAFLAAGGLPEVFFFAHEETDLAWRLLGMGFRLEYDASVLMSHHAMPNARHATFYWHDGRNRVLLARRNLPWPLAALYLFDWFSLTVIRERSVAAVRAWLAGFAEGWRIDPGGRQPMTMRTAWRMTRLGRPPIV